jgi:AcrR family transcriptional regulator
MFAVTLQLVVSNVKGLQQARVTATEQRILTAARELFVRKGYHGTTLTQVADAAGVGHRTVYVRFGTKAALLRRVVDVAVAGDPEPVAVQDRDWFQRAVTAPTLDERLDALVGGTAELMARAGTLFGLVLEAQSTEPQLAAAMQAGREATRDSLRSFVRGLVSDGLVESRDPEWLAETVALAGQAETFLLLQRTTGWDIERYRTWLGDTLRRVMTS